MDQFKDIDEVINKITLCEDTDCEGDYRAKGCCTPGNDGDFCDGNVLLEVCRALKTQLVKTLSKVLGLSFSRIQFTRILCPRMLPARIWL